jgi:hypothetical protein
MPYKYLHSFLFSVGLPAGERVGKYLGNPDSSPTPSANFSAFLTRRS